MGLAIDTLQVETLDGTPMIDERVWQQVEADLQATLAGERHINIVPSLRRHPARERQFQTFVQQPYVVIDNSSSDTHTIVEVKAQDSFGLLYKLTRVLYEQGLDIALAKISTEANRAIDVFYVTDADGHKILDDTAQEEMRQSLITSLR
jgi:[protein-PII] uridylyltransferase